MKSFFQFFLIVIVFTSCSTKDRFKMLPGEVTGIEFNNRITSSDSFNILTYEYIYNGGGVAIADFDNNGLQDVYLTGNMVSNELYLNQGDLKFEKITSDAGVSGEMKWCSGVAIADINADGWQDIYICVTAHPDKEKRRNILYINKGLNEKGIPTFVDEAESYHLNDTSHTANAAFLDYDNDGDLDLFLAVNKMTNGRNANVYKSKEDPVERIDKLFRNDWPEGESHPVFTDVSKEAGITHDGFSLGVNVTDINKDGWNDIFVTNDYLTNDLVYINKGDGTFEDKAKQYFKHTSHSAMGNDVVDVNNDGLPEVIALDMLPEDNYRRKTMLGANNYTTYINNEKYGYQYQFVRNTFQWNQGKDPGTGDLVFSDVAFLSGLSATDWSWTPLVADFDNDGYRDVIVTNGFPRDVTDRDFIDYYGQAGNYASKSFLMQFMPSVKIKNYAFRNTGGLIFEDVTDSWGIKAPSFSNGAAYADLDNDGDLDYVVNNIDEMASVFENLTNEKEGDNHNWLRIKLKGPKTNVNGMGTKLLVYYDHGKFLYADHSIYRGYLSTMEPDLHFGLGATQVIDSIVVNWPQGNYNKVENIKVNQVITLDISSSKPKTPSSESIVPPLFNNISALFSEYKHSEMDFIDFNVQPLLLHKFSQYGPGLAVGDVNGDGLDDVYVSGSHEVKGSFFIQGKDGTFKMTDLFKDLEPSKKREEELGTLLFDADSDGDLDLYSVSGGYEYSIADSCYRHMFFENQSGIFKRNDQALPDFLLSGSCVKAADFDRDGDLDLFVGGRVIPHQYPLPVTSYVLKNESKLNSIKFSLANDIAPQLNNIGLVCDALWSDFDNDGWVDLIIAGEWMPIRFFRNNKGKLEDVSNASGIDNKVGWWNSITGADFDKDGDIDYVVGNLGLNTLNKASDAEPVSIYASDFDKNERLDIMPTVYFKDLEGKKAEFPFFGRLDIQKEMIKTKRNFLKHADFGRASMQQILPEENRIGALAYKANYFSSAYIENNGSGKFSITELPLEAQLAPLYGMIPEDVNSDGNVDLVCVGNDYGTEVSMGRYDALNGLVLLGNGQGKFRSATIQESGICVTGDAKAFASILSEDGKLIMLATQNKGSIQAFEQSLKNRRIISFGPDICRIEFILEGNKKMIKEVYFGNSFLSQSSRKVSIPIDARDVVLISFSGERKTLNN